MVEIIIKPEPTSLGESIRTEGYVILYMTPNGKIQAKGTMDIQALMPYISRMIMEKIAKG
jgi:hypothetical protein